MIELISFFVVILIAWLLIKFISRKFSIEDARTKGVEKAKAYLKSPILVEDYVESKGVSKAEVDLLIGQGKIPAYSWHGYTFVENDFDAT